MKGRTGKKKQVGKLLERKKNAEGREKINK